PDGQGIDWLREQQQTGVTPRVVILSGRSDVVDRVVGLESGASDYLTKPFVPRELAARIRVQARERLARSAVTLKACGVELDIGSRSCTYGNRSVELVRMEFQLLKLLLENPGRVFSREELLNQVWGFDALPTTRTVDTHVLQLRQKLDASLIETVRGVGYRLR